MDKVNNDIYMARAINAKLSTHNTEEVGYGIDAYDVNWYGYEGYNLKINIYSVSNKEEITIKYYNQVVLNTYTSFGSFKLNKYVPGPWEKLLEGIYQNIKGLAFEKREKERLEDFKYKLSHNIRKYCFNDRDLKLFNQILRDKNMVIISKEKTESGIEFDTHYTAYTVYTVYSNNNKVFKFNTKQDYDNYRKDAFTINYYTEGAWVYNLKCAFSEFDNQKILDKERSKIEEENKIDEIVRSLNRKFNNY